MAIFISSNSFIKTGFKNVFKVLDILEEKIEDKEILNKVGIEIFPNFDNEEFKRDIENTMEEIKKYPISLHGPYFNIEHSAKKGTSEYERAKGEFIKILDFSKEVKADHIVFHHNNRRVDEENRLELIETANENLKELNELSRDYNIEILVENAGVNLVSNNIFKEEEFIKTCKELDNKVLIDIGHAHANSWDLLKVMESLKDKIYAYHVHNNDGRADSHERIHNGTLDFNAFMENYKRLTPNAHIVVEYGYQYGDKFQEIANDVIEILKLKA